MEKERRFGRFYSRLRLFAMLRALLAAFCVGLVGNAVMALVVWSIKGLNALWIAPVAGGILLLLTAPLFYFKRYMPNKQEIARQVDGLGLDERMVTMIELEGDESEIAQLQRKDAFETMQAANHKGLRFAMPISAVVLLVTFALASASATVVAALSIRGQVASGYDFLDGRFSENLQSQLYSVSYVAGEGGIIEGDADQLVPFGGSSDTVVAVADDGWVFMGWDDGAETPARSEKDVLNDIVLKARFARAEPSDDGDSDGPPVDGWEDQPQEPKDPNNNGGSGNKNEKADQVIDGDTDYRDVLESYLLDAMQKLAEGGDIPGDVRAMIEAYYNIIT